MFGVQRRDWCYAARFSDDQDWDDVVLRGKKKEIPPQDMLDTRSICVRWNMVAFAALLYVLQMKCEGCVCHFTFHR